MSQGEGRAYQLEACPRGRHVLCERGKAFLQWSTVAGQGESREQAGLLALPVAWPPCWPSVGTIDMPI